MRVPPLRSLNDFLFSCYSVPDKESVNERFTSNMLYYQTNYFLVTAVLIGINLILSPISVVVSSCTLAFAVALCNNLDSWWPFASRPSNVVIYAIVCTAVLLYMLPMMTPTILCLASISLVIMLHALLRQRNMMNKVTRLLDANAPDRYRSPMGLLLGKYGE
ncbi:PRA1 family protein 2 [Echinococcus multilocularis]|uniref:PRA1 family protein n=1 Tax=Echinococcus multilocularis TaxID=6211 RepID=A0A068Y8Z8_ECHMU|nr:PRA1 family protein 2 [Echinococcus multilocularis]